MGHHLVKTQILLTTYNGEKYLPDLLESMDQQTDPDFFLLIQDDGSTDGTMKMLRDYAGRNPRVSFGRESGQHLGPAGNFLSLIRQADADAVMLCDQDDSMHPDKVRLLKEALAEETARWGAETPLLVHSDCFITNEAGEITGDSFFAHQGWDPDAVTLPPLLVQNNVTGCTLIMNRALTALIAEYGKARDLFMHDWFIALTAAAFGRIRFVPRQLTYYRQHGDNSIGASAKGLIARGLEALSRRDEARRRIQLTYTHTQVFRRMYGSRLPGEAEKITSAYLATRSMGKLRRIWHVRRLGCTMQSPVTRLGQMLFG